MFENRIHPSFIFLASAFIAETFALTLYYPYNLFKWRLQTSNRIYQYQNLVHAFQKEIKENGVLSLYKGWWPFLIMFSTTIAIQFTIYETYMRHIRDKYNSSYNNHGLFHIVWGSFLAGAIGHAVTNGLEVIVVSTQWVPDWSIKSIWEKERFGILTKGIGARVYYQSTQSIIFFITIAYVGKFFKVKIED